MSGLWNDFNDAQSNTNLIPKGTLAKVRLTIRPGGFDDPSQGWTGGYATRGSTGAVYLNGEFTVTEGQYARRKIFTLIDLYSPKGLVRVVARRADEITDFGDARLWSETTRIDLRVAEVANPRPGDRIEIDGDAFLIQGEPVRDRERLVWTVDLRPA